LFEKYGEEILYKKGLYVKTSLDNNLQKIATNSLRKYIEFYDRRHGWRGPIKHLKNLSEWKEKKNILKLDQLNN